MCVSRYFESSAACVLVSSPPIVCRIVTPSLTSCFAATSSGTSPSLMKPFFTQSATFVSLTRELPIGEPPWCVSVIAFARTSGVIVTKSPVSRPL